MMKLIPYFPPPRYTPGPNGVRIKIPGSDDPIRAIVIELIEYEEVVRENIITPGNYAIDCGRAKVISSCSEGISEGDIILFNPKKMDTLEFDGHRYITICDFDVFAVNEIPYNSVFIEPQSTIRISESGLVIPASSEAVTQKGTVYLSPPEYFVEPGDDVEYRTNAKDIYPVIRMDGKCYDVVPEKDIYLCNEEVSPYRMIVKLDKKAQAAKRANTSDTGLAVPQQFIAMKHNLQYAEVHEIGEVMQSHYPDLNVGDTILISHIVESQSHRVIRKDVSKGVVSYVAYEYLIMSPYQEGNREIFGKLAKKIALDSKNTIRIIPYNENVFLKWDIEFFESQENNEFESHFKRCKNIFDLSHAIEKKKSESVNNLKMQKGRIGNALNQMSRDQNPDDFIHGDHMILQLQEEAKRMALFLNKDHLIKCKVIFPALLNNEVLTHYRLVYPIDIKGHKFLILHPRFKIAFFIKHNNEMKLIGKRVLVEPIPEQESEDLFIPKSAQAAPQKGTVISVGPGEGGVSLIAKPGDTVLYRKGAGIEITHEGRKLLIMTEGIDTIAVL